MKKKLPLILILLLSIVVAVLYHKNTNLRVGMTKLEVLEKLNLKETMESISDTVSILLPNSWFGGNPEKEIMLYFNSDTLAGFDY